MSRPATLTRRLGAYIAGEARGGHPARARHAARRCLVDWFASLLAGAHGPAASALRAALADEIGAGGAVLRPDGARAPPRLAALVNGAASHTVECDDIFRDALYHPGCPVFSAALPLAETRRLNGAALLDAAIVGYEVSTRLGLAAGAAHYTHWHNTATIGCFGAAAAGARALGLEAEAAHHALALAATMAAGLQQAFRSDSLAKPLHGGRAAETGVLAALAAASGMTGANDMLEEGFGPAMAGRPDWHAALADLGQSYNIERTTFKAHACCGHSFAALDALLALRASGLETSEVARVRVGTYVTAVAVVGNTRPRTAAEARFSLPFCAALALTDGVVTVDSFSDARLADERLRALAARVEVATDTDAEAAFPDRRSARVLVETTGGAQLEQYAPTRRGDPEAPLDDAELETKFVALVGPVLGPDAARALLARLWSVEMIADVSVLGVSAAPPEADR